MSDQNSNPPVLEVLDQRHLYRMKLTQALFALEFAEGKYQALSEEEDNLSIKKDAEIIYADRQILDDKIKQYATERPLNQINKADLAVLRLIVFESEHKKTPKKVLIDEAVELSKKFGSENSPKFVNGVLGKLLLGSNKSVKN